MNPIVLQVQSKISPLPVARTVQRSVGRLFDLSFAIMLTTVAVPITLLCAVLIKLTSRGPVFYTQNRCGIHGRIFTIYKLRSMYNRCEDFSGIRWSAPGDIRVTAVGRVLRKLHIDELPQLWNVIRGDMRFVGPRPERPEIVSNLLLDITDYEKRLMVQPGVTGLAQIQSPPDTSLESVKTKLNYDLCYVQKQNLFLDLRILFGTMLYLIGLPYASVSKWALLPSIVDESATMTVNRNPVPEMKSR